MLDKIQSLLTSDKEMGQSALRLLSLLFLLACGSLSFLSYVHNGRIYDSELTFRPGLISGIVAITLVAPLYLRGIFKWNNSFYTLLSLMLILLVFSSFSELAVGGNDTSDILYALIGLSVILSWIGIKSIAGISWMLALAAAVYSIIINDMAMDFWGWLYITSGFIGLLLHSEMGPGEFLHGIKDEFSPSVTSATTTVKSDIDATTTLVKNVIN